MIVLLILLRCVVVVHCSAAAPMRLKKGSRVEVTRKKELPPGSWWWWCAKIISGNGHTYSVKYYDVDGTVERVPRKVIRPCPPPVEGLRSWVSGDIVEVFERHSWKLAEVSSVACGNCFHVRLLGTHRSFRAHKSMIRWRQAWEEDEWIVIPKTTRRLNSQRRGELEKYVADDDAAESNNMHAPVFKKKGTNNQNPRAAAATVGHFIGSTEPNNDADDQSVSSSVGSCSPGNGNGSHLHHPVNCATHIDSGSEGDDDDAESLSSSRRRRRRNVLTVLQ